MPGCLIILLYEHPMFCADNKRNIMEDLSNFDPSTIAARAKMEQLLEEAREYRQTREAIRPAKAQMPDGDDAVCGRTTRCCGKILKPAT
jgi:hypothetical protein